MINFIYANYHLAIIHLVETNSGTREDAHDVFQEGLVVMFQKTKDPDFELTSQFLTYLYAICRNIWSNRLRKKSGKEVSLEDSFQETVADNDPPITDDNEQYHLYRKMFLRLGEGCQKILRLYLRKTTMETIMKKMGFSSINYTKKRKFMCKEKLVKLIKNDRSFSEISNP